eukprot:14718778-Ditylum_brightwellii.AAC.1
MAMVQLARSKYQVDKVVTAADNSLVVPIWNLLSRSKKNDISKSMLPLILDTLVKFCRENQILLPFLQQKNDDDISVLSNITTLTGMAIKVG